MPSDSSRWILAGAVLCASGCTAPQIVDSAESDWLSPPEPAEFDCADLRAAEFCADFDSDAWIDSWNDRIEIIPEGNGFVDRSEDVARSKPGALLATIGGTYDGVDYAASFIRQNFATFKNRPFKARISFQLRVEAFDSRESARISVLNFLFGDVEELNMLVLNLESRGSSVAAQFTESSVGASGFTPGDFKTIPNREWQEVVLELDIVDPQGEGNRATMSINGDPLFDGLLQYRLAGLTPRMELGIPWVDTERATEEWQLRFDNILVEMQPLD